MPPAPSIVWLASYPRSGNTWARTLLHAYAHGPPAASAEVAATVPDLHAPTYGGGVARPFGSTGTTLVKTHFLWSPQHPHAAATTGAICFVRHPKDVLLSSLNFHRVMGSKGGAPGQRASADFDEAAYVRTFINRAGDPGFIDAGYGSWEQNVRSWTQRFEPRRLVVKYHELRAQPEHWLRAMLEFLGEPIDEPRLARALAAGSFEAMRALEVREKSTSATRSHFFGGSMATLRKGHRFMDQGRVGGTLAPVVPGADGPFDHRFGGWIDEFGLGVE